MKRRNKYGAKATCCNHGHTHDSKREAKRCEYDKEYAAYVEAIRG